MLKKMAISIGFCTLVATKIFCDELGEVMGNTLPGLSTQTQNIIGKLTAGGIVWGLIFSSVGVGFFMYGKRKENMKLMFAAAALVAYPYVVQETTAIIIVGIL